MDPNLCIDPSLLSQFLEEDEVSTLLVDVDQPNQVAQVVSSRSSPLEIFASTSSSSNSNRRKDLNAGPTLPNIILQEDQETVEHQQQPTTKIQLDKKAHFLAQNLDEAKNKFLHSHEKEFGLKFVTRKSPKNFGHTNWKAQILSKKKIYFDGENPFIKCGLNSLVMECPFGPDHDLIKKEQRKRSRVNYDENQVKFTDTKKIGCPVKFVFEERIYFNAFKGTKNRDKLKKKLNERDFEALDEFERKIYVTHFGEHSHKNRKCEKNDEFYFDSLIKKFVWNGIENSEEIRMNLAKFIYEQKVQKSLIKVDFIERKVKICQDRVKIFMKEQQKLELFTRKMDKNEFKIQLFKREAFKSQIDDENFYVLDENDKILGLKSKNEVKK